MKRALISLRRKPCCPRPIRVVELKFESPKNGRNRPSFLQRAGIENIEIKSRNFYGRRIATFRDLEHDSLNIFVLNELHALLVFMTQTLPVKNPCWKQNKNRILQVDCMAPEEKCQPECQTNRCHMCHDGQQGSMEIEIQRVVAQLLVAGIVNDDRAECYREKIKQESEQDSTEKSSESHLVLGTKNTPGVRNLFCLNLLKDER